MPPPPPPPTPGHSCNTAAIQQCITDANNGHLDINAEMVQKYESLQGYVHHYGDPTYPGPSPCYRMAVDLAVALDAFIALRNSAFQIKKTAAQTCLAAVGHPDPTGACVSRLATALSYANDMVQHYQQTRYMYEGTYLALEQQMVSYCGAIS